MHKTGGFLHIQQILRCDTKRARRDKECAPQQQSAAGGYIREESFRLDVNADHFLYESTTKRKIENNTQKK